VGQTLDINVTGNYVPEEGACWRRAAAGGDGLHQFGERQFRPRAAARRMTEQGGCESPDPGAAIGLGPLVRVNGIAPATVIAGSSMLPRDRDRRAAYLRHRVLRG
jgi:hypothetical protein